MLALPLSAAARSPQLPARRTYPLASKFRVRTALVEMLCYTMVRTKTA